MTILISSAISLSLLAGIFLVWGWFSQNSLFSFAVTISLAMLLCFVSSAIWLFILIAKLTGLL